MKNSDLLAIVGLIVTILVSACTGTPTSNLVAAATSTPLSTPTAIPIYTSTAIPTDTPSPRPTRTPTLAPTHTLTPLPTHTPTYIPTPIPTDTPTSSPTPAPIPIEPVQISQSEGSTTAEAPPQPVEQTGDRQESLPNPAPPSTRTVRVGLHGRNDQYFAELDYQLIREARIETLKMMSLTDPSVFERIKRENPNIEFIVRLYDDRINAEGHPTPQEYVEKMTPMMERLRPYVTKFEVGNEPNHVHRYEGWGSEDADAENFNAWFIEVYDLLKKAHPWALLGYPALATPDSYHRDRIWLQITRQAINRADWLGVHCYWQTQPDQSSTMFDLDRGMCFKYYHEQFPDKPLEITEFDNDNIIWDVPPNSAEEIAQQYVTYYQELFKYPYIRSASSFIMSSPDPRWDYFAWRTEGGGLKPTVTEIANMPRPPLAQ